MKKIITQKESKDRDINNILHHFDNSYEFFSETPLHLQENEEPQKESLSFMHTAKSNYKSKDIIFPTSRKKILFFNKMKLHLKKKKERKHKNRLKELQSFILNVLSNVINCLAVLNYITQTYFDTQYDDALSVEVSKYLAILEVSFSIYFVFEYIIICLTKIRNGLLRYIFSMDTFIDAITTIPSLMSYFWNGINLNFNFMRVFRIFRVFRILRIYKTLKLMEYEYDENKINIEEAEEKLSSLSKRDPVKFQFIKAIVVMCSALFIGSGLILGIQDLLPNAFNKPNLNFFDAIYFMVITYCTIGYGDILPTHIISRTLIIVGLFCILFLISDQLNKLAQLLKIWGPGLLIYRKFNHIIAIVDCTVELSLFLSTLKSVNETKTEVIIISKDIEYLPSKEFPFNKVQLMKTTTMDYDVLERANAKHAKAIFIFTSKNLTNLDENEKVSDIFLLKINRYFKHVPIYLQSLYSDRSFDRKHLQFSKIIPIFRFKTLIQAKSLFNPGFPTFIQNLIFNDENPKMDVGTYSNIIQQYLLGCENKIHIRPIPSLLYFEQFSEVSRIIYNISIEGFNQLVTTVDDKDVNRPVLLVGVVYQIEEKGEKQVKYEYFPDDTIKPEMAGIFISYDERGYLDKVLNVCRASNRVSIEKVLSRRRAKGSMSNKVHCQVDGSNTVDDKLVLDENKFPKVSYDQANKIIELSNESEDFEENHEKDSNAPSSDQQIDICPGFDDNNNNNNNVVITQNNINLIKAAEIYKVTSITINSINKEATQRYGNSSQDIDKLINQERNNNQFVDPRIIDLEKVNLTDYVSNHIIIIGYQESTSQLLKLLIYHYPNKDICIFTNSNYEDLITIKLLRQFKNLFYLRGCIDNPFHLLNSGITKAQMVIFLTESVSKMINDDMKKILSFRAVEYYFDCTTLLELWHSKSLRLLSSQPVIYGYAEQVANEFLHPGFMCGGLLYLNHFDRIIAKSFLNEMATDSWIEMLHLGFSTNTCHGFQTLCGKVKNFPVIITIDVPPEFIGVEYSRLVDELLDMKSSVICLGVYIQEPLNYASKITGKVFRKSRKSEGKLKIITSHKTQIMNRVQLCKSPTRNGKTMQSYKQFSYNGRIVADYVDLNQTELPIFITNPHPSFILDSSCKIQIMCRLTSINSYKRKNVIQNLEECKVSRWIKPRASLSMFLSRTSNMFEFNRRRYNILKLQNKFFSSYDILKEKMLDNISEALKQTEKSRSIFETKPGEE